MYSMAYLRRSEPQLHMGPACAAGLGAAAPRISMPFRSRFVSLKAQFPQDAPLRTQQLLLGIVEPESIFPLSILTVPKLNMANF